jgi:hypothetical protein
MTGAEQQQRWGDLQPLFWDARRQLAEQYGPYGDDPRIDKWASFAIQLLADVRELGRLITIKRDRVPRDEQDYCNTIHWFCTKASVFHECVTGLPLTGPLPDIANGACIAVTNLLADLEPAGHA